MNLACEILASFLLIFTVPTKGQDPESSVVWGALDHDLNLDLPDFQRRDLAADIKWNRNKNKIARIKKDMLLYNETDKYGMFTNGTLKIKTLMRNDSGLYEVEVYDSNGVNLLSKNFDLKIQGGERLSYPYLWVRTSEVWGVAQQLWEDEGVLCVQNLNSTSAPRICRGKEEGISICDQGPRLYVYQFLQEMLSGPEINWICTNRTVSCKVKNGSDPKLQLLLNTTSVKQGRQRLITFTWNTKWNKTFKCVASNHVDMKVSTEIVVCPDEGLDLYLIIGICIGGVFFLIFVALLIFYISRRKKQSRRREDEELEIKAQRAILEERGRKPHQIPASTPANPGMSQIPPVPGHRSQPPTHRPRPLGPRVQPQQKRLPPTPGTQVHQQKGPPLPKPRVQTKPPCDAEENS